MNLETKINNFLMDLDRLERTVRDVVVYHREEISDEEVNTVYGIWTAFEGTEEILKIIDKIKAELETDLSGLSD